MKNNRKKKNMKWTRVQKVCIGSSSVGCVCTVCAMFVIGTKLAMPLIIIAIVLGMVPLFVSLTLSTLEAVDRAIYIEAKRSLEQKQNREREAKRDEIKLNRELENLDRILKHQAV